MEMKRNDTETTKTTTSSASQQQQYMFTEEAPQDEHQPLLWTFLTRRDDDSERFLQAENDMERDLDQLIALKNWEELEEGNWDTCHRYV